MSWYWRIGVAMFIAYFILTFVFKVEFLQGGLLSDVIGWSVLGWLFILIIGVLLLIVLSVLSDKTFTKGERVGMILTILVAIGIGNESMDNLAYVAMGALLGLIGVAIGIDLIDRTKREREPRIIPPKETMEE